MTTDQPASTASDSSAFATPLAIVIAAIMISGAILYSNASDSSGTSAVIAEGGDAPVVVDVNMEELVDDDPVIGNPDAPVTIVEFSDFQCPFCRQFFTATHPQIISDYIDTGKAKLVYRDFPLEFHPASHISALAGECADEQGRFWEYHDHMFQEQAKQGTGTITYGSVELKQWARDIGLNANQFDQCLDSEKYADEVDKDFEDGQRAGVSGTPSFFINGQLIIGAQPFATFQQAIDAALN